MNPFEGRSVNIAGVETPLRLDFKALMKLDYELGEKYGLKESILVAVTLVDGKQRIKTNRLMEWLTDLGPGSMLRWAMLLYAAVMYTKRWHSFDEFLESVDGEEEISAGISILAEVLRQQLSDARPKAGSVEAAAESPLSREINSGGTSGPLPESISS